MGETSKVHFITSPHKLGISILKLADLIGVLMSALEYTYSVFSCYFSLA